MRRVKFFFWRIVNNSRFYFDNPGVFLLIPSIDVHLTRRNYNEDVVAYEVGLVWFKWGVYYSYILRKAYIY